jgi:predicted dehydrogenase
MALWTQIAASRRRHGLEPLAPGQTRSPFDPHVYLEFRLYKDFSSGIFDQWLSHGCDLVHLWTDEAYPESVMATGGVFTWPDGRENPDTAVAAVTYPKGFLYTYKTIFGNSYRSFARIQGRDGTIDNLWGRGCIVVYCHPGRGQKGI